MQWLFFFLLGSLVAGQLGGISLTPGVVIYLHDIFAFMLLVLTGWNAVRQGRFVTPRLIMPIRLFVAAAAISLVANAGKYSPAQLGEAALYLLRWILYAGIYVAALQQKTMANALKRGLYVAGSIVSLLGLIQLVLYPSLRNLWYLGWDPHYYRLFSTFLDPNFAGVGIVLTLFVGLTDAKLFPRRVLWFTQFMNLLALYLTYSRSSYLAFATGVVVWIILKKEWKLLVGLVFFGLVLLLPTPGGDTLKLTRLASTVSRVENWQASMIRFSEAPVFGHGFNTLRFRPIFDAPPIMPGVVSKAAAGVDSSVLFLLITTGVVGFLLYAWLLYRMTRISKEFVVILAALLVHSVFVNSLVYPWVLLFVWIYLGASERSSTSGT